MWLEGVRDRGGEVRRCGALWAVIFLEGGIYKLMAAGSGWGGVDLAAVLSAVLGASGEAGRLVRRPLHQ